MRYRGLAIAMAAVALASCALSTPPSHDDVVSQSLPTDTAVPDAWQSSADSAPVQNDWIKSFNDPVLEALVEEGIVNNRDLAQAAQRVRMAQQAVIIAGARLRPGVHPR